jgi:aspartyl-tRNA synthetase
MAAAKGVTVAGGGVKALVVPGKAMGAAPYSRKQIEELEAQARIYKAKGLAWMKVAGTEAAPILEGGVSKFFGDDAGAPPSGKLAGRIVAALGAKPGDLLLFVADARRRIANIALGAVRSKLGKDLGLYDAPSDGQPRFEFAWIVDFPLFEFNEEENHWEAAHHMFS